MKFDIALHPGRSDPKTGMLKMRDLMPESFIDAVMPKFQMTKERENAG